MKDVAIVGMPGSGKSTVFTAVSRQPTSGAIGSQAVVEVPDQRLEEIARIYSSAKITRAQVRLVDVAGIDAHSLGSARAADALAVVLRAFGDDADPKRDLASFRAELAVADLATVEKVLDRASRQAKSSDAQAVLEVETCKRAEEVLHDGRWLSDEDWTPEQRRVVSLWTPLTMKPAIHVINAEDPATTTDDIPEPRLLICGLLEAEATELAHDDAAALLAEFGVNELGADAFIRAAYEAIGLLTFFTAGETEARAWECKRGSKAPAAAGVIHSDFERGFIKADRVRFTDLVEAGSEDEARRRGLLRLEGREYEVQEGDILLIRHSS
jgi:ribosome-binding ATPase YchF (GTP1/OBG family)